MSASGLTELLPPLTTQEALVESGRCLYCYDAPCAHACPTHIDIASFIRKISTGNLAGSAATIFDSNLLGATCARVCPVQELCEGACVLGSEHKPIAIGRLQRHAMDNAYSSGRGLPVAAALSGHRVAVVGAGPAGLSCAGELAKRGHQVTLFEKRGMGGGLSTYGIIALREPVEVALREVEMIAGLGVEIRTGVEFGSDVTLESLAAEYGAVFLSVGLGKTPSLGIPGEEMILDGLEFIEQSKAAPGSVRVGKQVLVIGAGNTAIDCATIAVRLGAEKVTMVYRRTDREMTAYPHEYAFVQREGVQFEFLAQPVAVVAEGLRCVRVKLVPGPVVIPGSEFTIPGDQIVKAIGQEKYAVPGLATERGFISVDGAMQTSVAGVWAGGDCVRARGAASTVMAVQDGKLAAAAISKALAKGTE